MVFRLEPRLSFNTLIFKQFKRKSQTLTNQYTAVTITMHSQFIIFFER